MGFRAGNEQSGSGLRQGPAAFGRCCRLVRDVGTGGAFPHGFDAMHCGSNVRVRSGEGQYGPAPVKDADEKPAPVGTDEFEFAGRRGPGDFRALNGA